MPASPDAIRSMIQDVKKGDKQAEKDALQALIEHIHHTQPVHKIAAAKGISEFIARVPDLEEDAINAAYDLCEDLDLSVRLQGYETITAISRVLPRSIKRNADVLVQLLQSDEDEEVKCVKSALLRHLELDAAVTIGVFMDQIMSSSAGAEPEDQQARDQLRTCAISFLTSDEIARSLLQVAKTDGIVHNMLLDGITEASSKIDFDESRLLVDKIFARLPGASTHSAQLLDNLVNAHLSNPAHTSNDKLSYFQSLVESGVVPASRLLLSLYFGLPMTSFRRLSSEVRVSYACNAAGLLSLLKPTDIPPAEMDVLREKTVMLATLALPVILDSRGKNEPQHQMAGISYLTTLVDRKNLQPTSQLPSNLSQTLQRLSSSLSASQDNNTQIQTIQDLIRSLVPLQTEAQPAPKTNTNGASANPQDSVSHSNGTPERSLNRVKRPSEIGQEQPAKRIRQEPKTQDPPALLRRMRATGKEKELMVVDSTRETPTLPAQKDDVSVGLSIKGAAVRESKAKQSEETPSLASRISGVGFTDQSKLGRRKGRKGRG